MARKRTEETDANVGEQDPSAHAAEGAVKTKAKKERAPSMIHAWGETFARAAAEGLSREQVMEEMKAKFPSKAETVDKWVDWYKNFYNMGRIKGHENPVKVLWQSEAQAKRAAEKQSKAEARALKKQQKEEERQQKIAEREAKKAEKRAKATAE